MSIQIDSINHGTAKSRGLSALNLTKNSVVRFVGQSTSPNYPRLASHEGILIRTLAIADNLDEVMMLPQNMVFPLRMKKQPLMRRKVNKTKAKDGAANLGKRKRDQEDEYEDFEDYKY